MTTEFDAIRPYNDEEVREAIDSLLHDRHFSQILKGMVPLPLGLTRGLLRLATIGIHSTLGFQLRFMKPVVKHILRKCTTGHSFSHEGIQPGKERYTFISNHRDIVLDSAILDVMLHDAKFPTTCEIAIGDNLLIYPWIRTLVPGVIAEDAGDGWRRRHRRRHQEHQGLEPRSAEHQLRI